MATPLTITPSEPLWHVHIFRGLQERDRREKEAFEDLISARKLDKEELERCRGVENLQQSPTMFLMKHSLRNA